MNNAKPRNTKSNRLKLNIEAERIVRSLSYARHIGTVADAIAEGSPLAAAWFAYDRSALESLATVVCRRLNVNVDYSPEQLLDAATR
jgi:hypothetical protein